MSKSLFTKLAAFDDDDDIVSEEKAGGGLSASEKAKKKAAKKVEKDDLASLAYGKKKKGSGAAAPAPAPAPVKGALPPWPEAAGDEKTRKRREESTQKEYEDQLALALQESLKVSLSTGLVPPPAGPKEDVLRSTVPKSILHAADVHTAVDKAVAQELRMAKFRDEMADERRAAAAAASVSSGPGAPTVGSSGLSGRGAGGGGGAVSTPKGDGRGPVSTPATGSGKKAPPGLTGGSTLPGGAPASGPPAPLVLPSIADATKMKADQLLQMYAIQTYELKRLQEENVSLQRQAAESQARVAEVEASDKAEMMARMKQLKATTSELGLEVARLHMEGQRHLTRIKELEIMLHLGPAK